MHIYFVLDRFGSMQSIAPDVTGGFNAFLAAQQADGSDVLLTLVQFDSQDLTRYSSTRPPSRVHDPSPRLLSCREVGPRSTTRWVTSLPTPPSEPRGGASRTNPRRRSCSSPSPTGRRIDLIKKWEVHGWSFAYLGANQDAYAEGGRIGYSAASSQNLVADAAGTAAVFASSSAAILRRRSKIRSGETYDPADLFEG